MQTEVVAVEIKTHVGHSYVFPDVARTMLANAIELEAWSRIDNIVLVNIYAASLCVPKDTIEKVLIGKEVLWSSPNA